MKILLYIYLATLLILTVIPINGTGDILDNNYTLNIRWDYIVHALVYVPMISLLMMRNQKSLSHKFKALDLKIIIIAIIIAILLEAIQLLIPWRTFNVNDMGSNILGVVLGVIVLMIFKDKFYSYAK